MQINLVLIKESFRMRIFVKDITHFDEVSLHFFTEINVSGFWRLQAETGCMPSAQCVFCDGNQFQVLQSLVSLC